MKRTVFFKKLAGAMALLAVVLFIGFPACNAQAKQETIKIAVTCSLTGPHAAVAGFCYGEMDYYTYLNEFKGGILGHPIDSTLYDGAETPKELATYRAFSSKVHSMSLYSTMANKALTKEINEIDLISSITGGMDERIIAPYVFMVGPSYQTQFYVSFKRMVENGGKTVVIGHGNYEWMVEMPEDAVAKKLPEKAGIKLLGMVEHQSTSSEITAEVARIKRLNPDYIWIWGDAVSTVAAAVRLGIPGKKLFVNHWYTLPVLTKKFGKKVDGMMGWLMLPSVDMVLEDPELRVSKELNAFLGTHKPYTRNWTYIRGWLIGTLRSLAIERALQKNGNKIPADIKEFRTQIRDELENIKGFDLGIGHGFETVDYSDHMGWGGMMPAVVKDGKWDIGKYQSFN